MRSANLPYIYNTGDAIWRLACLLRNSDLASNVIIRSLLRKKNAVNNQHIHTCVSTYKFGTNQNVGMKTLFHPSPLSSKYCKNCYISLFFLSFILSHDVWWIHWCLKKHGQSNFIISSTTFVKSILFLKYKLL